MRVPLPTTRTLSQKGNKQRARSAASTGFGRGEAKNGGGGGVPLHACRERNLCKVEFAGTARQKSRGHDSVTVLITSLRGGT
jgi:hypothetical protein